MSYLDKIVEAAAQLDAFTESLRHDLDGAMARIAILEQTMPPISVLPPPPIPTPSPVESPPAWLEYPTLPALSGSIIRVKQPSELKAAMSMLKDGDTLALASGQVYDLNVLLGDALRISKNDILIRAYGEGDNPKLLYDGAFQVVSITGSRVRVENIDVARKTGAGRQLTSGFYITGDDVHVFGANVGDIGELCFNVRPKSVRVRIENCANTGRTPGYFCYSNGSHVAVVGCKITRPGLHAFRVNNAKNQYLARNTFTGVEGSVGLSSLVILGIVSRVDVVDNTFIHAGLGLGPNMNRDGLAQAGDNKDAPVAERAAIMVAQKCENVTVRGNKMEGALAKITIGPGANNITATDNGPVLAYQVKKSEVLVAEGGTWPLPDPVNVTIDGVKAA
ncbi:MAG: hypothetical protein IT560_14315 [Alphaproteobacteria bacterium]|nr:hypothetical protein [Alphaproteobacteria bacterium]